MSLKKLFENYCSYEKRLISFYSTYAVKLIYIIKMLDSKLMKENLRNIIKKNPQMIQNIKYDKMDCKIICFFSDMNWIIIDVLILWLKCHDPTDKELVGMW